VTAIRPLTYPAVDCATHGKTSSGYVVCAHVLTAAIAGRPVPIAEFIEPDADDLGVALCPTCAARPPAVRSSSCLLVCGRCGELLIAGAESLTVVP
jgi:hypothetical protein